MNAEDNKRITNLVFSLPNQDGSYSADCQNVLDQFSIRRQVLLFIFPPKCGGTFLRSAAIKAIDGQLIRTCYAQGGREAQFYLPTFLQYYLGGLPDQVLVSHVHMQGRAGNYNLIEALNLKPVTMVRSISDMLVSTRDMFMNEAGSMAESVPCYVPEAFSEYDEARKADFLMDMLAPWYVSFYASWFEYINKNPGRFLVLKFDDLMDSPAELLKNILDHAGVPQSLETCQQSLDIVWAGRKQFRYNKGVPGRGAGYFSPAHFERLQKMIAQFPSLAGWEDDLL